jgi:hypothetical protein
MTAQTGWEGENKVKSLGRRDETWRRWKKDNNGRESASQEKGGKEKRARP